MKKITKMPTAIALLYFSYAILIFGIAISVWLLILRFSGFRSLLMGFSILITSFFLAVLARMFGNIGQILFDSKSLMSRELERLNQNIINLSSQSQNQNQELIVQIQSFRKSLEEVIGNSNKELDSSVRKGLQNIKSDLEQINCDSKDINQHIHQIQIFFEQIERHLELKK